MALVTTTGSSADPTPKQIVFNSASQGANTVFYTVPNGKTFVGHILATTASGWYFTINGVLSPSQSSTTPYYAAMLPLTLVSGTTIGTAGVTYNWMLIGVES